MNVDSRPSPSSRRLNFMEVGNRPNSFKTGRLLANVLYPAPPCAWSNGQISFSSVLCSHKKTVTPVYGCHSRRTITSHQFQSLFHLLRLPVTNCKVFSIFYAYQSPISKSFPSSTFTSHQLQSLFHLLRLPVTNFKVISIFHVCRTEKQKGVHSSHRSPLYTLT